MCATCGCGSESPRFTTFGATAGSRQGHGHGHGARRARARRHASRTVVLEERVLARNDLLAAENRRLMAERGVVAVNLMSSPGSGKTTLLARTVRELARAAMAVVEGDQETLLDAERIRATGCPVVQINTGEGCHLDAAMLRRGLDALDVAAGSLVFVENVGNLVCPALFDLGETSRVVVMSVTEGADKPAKYPHMFRYRGPGAGQQGGPAPVRGLRPGVVRGADSEDQPDGGGPARLGDDRGGPGGLVRMAGHPRLRRLTSHPPRVQ